MIWLANLGEGFWRQVSSTYVGEVPKGVLVSSGCSTGVERDPEVRSAYIRTTLRPTSRSLFSASTEFVLGPIVQIYIHTQGRLAANRHLHASSSGVFPYNRCAAVVLGGLESGVQVGQPVDPASEGDVVKCGSSHYVGRAGDGSRVSLGSQDGGLVRS